MFGLELRDKIFVTKPGLRPVDDQVVLELFRALHVHVARVPLVAEGRDAVQAPVDEDAELPILVPRRDGVALERAPLGRKGAVRDDLVD